MSRDGKSALPGLPGHGSDNLQHWAVAVVISVTVWALLAVGLRLASRRLNHQTLWWDDYMILFSMVWSLVFVGFVFAMHSSGTGIHADKVDTARIIMVAKWLVVAEVLYAWNLGWTKLSLLLMYGAKVVASAEPGPLGILIIPLPQIRKLQLRRLEKIGLTFALGLGVFVIFASAYRTGVLFTCSDSEPTYTLAQSVSWTAVAMAAGIVSACLPTLLPLLLCCARAFKSIRSAVLSRREANAPPTFGGTGGIKDKCRKGSAALGVSANRDDDDDDSGQDIENHLYRLPDVSDSDTIASQSIASRTILPGAPSEPTLRTDTLGYSHSVESYTIRGVANNDDDIPLRGIRVQTDFTKSVTREY